MLAQQPVHPYPPRTVFRRRQLGPKAAPRIGPQTLLHLKEPGTHRIEMPVVAGREQVAAAAPCHQLRLIPPAQNIAQEFMLVVMADGLGALQPSPAAHQVGVGRFQHQLVMMAQQTIRVNLPIGLLAGLGQRF